MQILLEMPNETDVLPEQQIGLVQAPALKLYAFPPDPNRIPKRTWQGEEHFLHSCLLPHKKRKYGHFSQPRFCRPSFRGCDLGGWLKGSCRMAENMSIGRTSSSLVVRIPFHHGFLHRLVPLSTWSVVVMKVLSLDFSFVASDLCLVNLLNQEERAHSHVLMCSMFRAGHWQCRSCSVCSSHVGQVFCRCLPLAISKAACRKAPHRSWWKKVVNNSPALLVLQMAGPTRSMFCDAFRRTALFSCTLKKRLRSLVIDVVVLTCPHESHLQGIQTEPVSSAWPIGSQKGDIKNSWVFRSFSCVACVRCLCARVMQVGLYLFSCGTTSPPLSDVQEA